MFVGYSRECCRLGSSEAALARSACGDAEAELSGEQGFVHLVQDSGRPSAKDDTIGPRRPTSGRLRGKGRETRYCVPARSVSSAEGDPCGRLGVRRGLLSPWSMSQWRSNTLRSWTASDPTVEKQSKSRRSA